MSVFMPLMFLGSKPTKPSFPKQTGDIKVDRKNKILHFDRIEEWKLDVKKWEEETEERESYINNIGMVYSNMSDAMPRCINGYPMFMSMKIASKEDSKRFLDMYREYEKVREDFEKNWGTEKADV
jgi:hypothetical protein